jgi:hypothetical protein
VSSISIVCVVFLVPPFLIMVPERAHQIQKKMSDAGPALLAKLAEGRFEDESIRAEIDAVLSPFVVPLGKGSTIKYSLLCPRCCV